jgi:hypothetical protein
VSASTIASVGASAEFDLVLAQLLASDERGLDFRLLHLLGPFQGVIGGRFRQEGHVTAGGRTLAAAILVPVSYPATLSIRNTLPVLP